jgi:hypothetical protein
MCTMGNFFDYIDFGSKQSQKGRVVLCFSRGPSLLTQIYPFIVLTRPEGALAPTSTYDYLGEIYTTMEAKNIIRE